MSRITIVGAPVTEPTTRLSPAGTAASQCTSGVPAVVGALEGLALGAGEALAAAGVAEECAAGWEPLQAVSASAATATTAGRAATRVRSTR